MNPIAIRLLSQQLICQQFSSPADVVSHIGAIQAQDYRWMLALCADKAEKTIRGWMKANKVAIDEGELHRIREILVRTCEEKGSATKEDFAEALRSRDIVMDDHRLTYHIRLSELSGTLCSGSLSPKYATYALTEGRIPHSSLPERDEMLCRLALKFFPVIVHDGVVCGNWSPWQESLKTELFRPVDGTLSVERQWEDFRKLMMQ